jgi:hypothetical protein
MYIVKKACIFLSKLKINHMTDVHKSEFILRLLA